MKKFLYIIALVAVTSLSLSSCTKEEVKPAGGNNLGGGAIRE